jgi:hypothetical protein
VGLGEAIDFGVVVVGVQVAPDVLRIPERPLGQDQRQDSARLQERRRPVEERRLDPPPAADLVVEGGVYVS